MSEYLGNLRYEFCWDKSWKTNAYFILMKLKKEIEIFNDLKCQATFGFEYIIQIIHSVRQCMFCVFHEVCKCVLFRRGLGYFLCSSHIVSYHNCIKGGCFIQHCAI